MKFLLTKENGALRLQTEDVSEEDVRHLAELLRFAGATYRDPTNTLNVEAFNLADSLIEQLQAIQAGKE
ncbi:MAG: hypothetical protein E6R04_01095 [Spirochaetes bacterium]|nr:MAG: hypothetical protein E6R04_01095 [Spirochaetota bacterium]